MVFRHDLRLPNAIKGFCGPRYQGHFRDTASQTGHSNLDENHLRSFYKPALNVLLLSLWRRLLGASEGLPVPWLLFCCCVLHPLVQAKFRCSCALEPSGLRLQPLAGSQKLCYIIHCSPLAFSTLVIAFHKCRNMYVDHFHSHGLERSLVTLVVHCSPSMK